jgi:D-hydroxyproline dehydrogenase subunit gamma
MMAAALMHQSAQLVTVTVDGTEMRLSEGMPLASALLAAGIRRLRVSPNGGTPRGAFCFMGACQECTVMVDGALSQACLVPVRAGMAVGLILARIGADIDEGDGGGVP